TCRSSSRRQARRPANCSAPGAIVAVPPARAARWLLFHWEVPMQRWAKLLPLACGLVVVPWFAGNAASGQSGKTVFGDSSGSLSAHVYERSNEDPHEGLNKPRVGDLLLLDLLYGVISGKVEDAEHAKTSAPQPSNQIVGVTFTVPNKTAFSLGSGPNGWTMTQ